MLTGKKLGKAIARAIQKKIDSGAVKSKAEVARHFGIKPPSIHTWINNGTVSKNKLPELWNYFSDVVGLEHWGISDQWLSGRNKSVWPFETGYEAYLSLDSQIKDAIEKFISIASKNYPINNNDYAVLTEAVNDAIRIMRAGK